MKPDGKGKLSKRSADKAGFPIFPLNWIDPETRELSIGFKEIGYLPDALINFLAFLGWSPSTEQEFFSLKALERDFSLDRINKAGIRFDIEKAKWFNQEYIKLSENERFIPNYIAGLEKRGITCSEDKANKIIRLLKGRVIYPAEMVEQSMVFFKRPETFDEKVVRRKWSSKSEKVLSVFAKALANYEEISSDSLKDIYWNTLASEGYNPGHFMQVLRLSLSGEGSGPDLMKMMEILGPKESIERMNHSIKYISKVKNNEE